jgi:hypothetical protein
MIAGTGKIRIRESNPTMRMIAQNIPRRRLAVGAEEKPRLRIHVRMAPAIQNDSRDVPARIESARREHVGHLFAVATNPAQMTTETDVKRRMKSSRGRGNRWTPT